MNIILFVLFCCCTRYGLSEKKSGFLLTCPSALLTNSIEKICISLHNPTGPVQASLTLYGAISGKAIVTSSSTFESVTKCLEFDVPETDEQLGRLLARVHLADNQLVGNIERTVTLQRDPLVVLVTLDKPQYRPGQDVLFRIFSLTHKLKPHNAKVDRIWVESPTGVRVQQWRDVEVVQHGLIQLKFTLDSDPFLGKWKIKVQHGSLPVVQKSFFVKEYIPAIFKVTVQSPTECLPNSQNISWNICARYSYGEIVLGNAHVEIKLLESRVEDQPSINNVVKLNTHTGCALFTIRGSELGLSDPLIRPSAVKLTATVTERGTGVSHSTSVISPVHNQPFTLHFQCSQYFKPGLPYTGNIIMRTMDGRPRLKVGERIQVCVKVRYRAQLAMKVLQCWNYTTDFSSNIVFALPVVDDPLNVQLFTLIAAAVDQPTALYNGLPEVMLLQPSTTHNVKPWFSPSHSYLDVWTRNTLACGSTHHVPVYYTVSSHNTTTPLFYYLVEGRGDLLWLSSVLPGEQSVVHSNTVSAGESSLVRSWRLPIPVSPEMAPQSRLSVYYVRSDGEVVAASTQLRVERCFQNTVRVRWESPQLAPRGKASLCIRASPDSICAVSVVDKQHIYNSSLALSDSESVWDHLKKFTLKKPLRDPRLYCINKNSREEETFPTYDLRKRRSLSMRPQDFADHVDAITAFDDMGVIVMSNLLLETRPCTKNIAPVNLHKKNWAMPKNIVARSSLAVDKLLMVTREEPYPGVDESSTGFQSLIRDYFPDTWIWHLAYTGREGEVRINTTAPDTITSWDTWVTCVSPRDGLGVAEFTALSVFQSFFLHIETPYAIKKGETVAIKVVVYNYMHHPISVVLGFSQNEGLHISLGMDTEFCVEGLTPHSQMVSVSAKVAGLLDLTVEAHVKANSSCGPPDILEISDTVTKQLLVRLDGHLKQNTYSSLICPSENPNPSVVWDLTLPDEGDLVPGSARLHFSVVADLFGPALENLDSLVLLPMGCGEQNLARLAPNLFVLKYMNAMGYKDEQLRAKALKNIKKGYQRQLTFQRKDGSFSPFGNSDESGSMWLTASVVKILSEASRIVDIDEDMLQNSVVWISHQQLENGCFPSIGQVFHTEVKEGEESEDSALSPLVVASLAASRTTLPVSLRSNAELCVTAVAASMDPNTLSIATLALIRLGLQEKANQALTNLLRLAVVENDLIHWGKPDNSISRNIVTTSYAVLCLVESGGHENMLIAQKAVRWISIHRNENGGFVSTQDTVVALEALTAYMTALPTVNRTDLMVFIKGDKLITKTFRLTDGNKLVQQRMTTVQIPSKLSVAVVGDGCAFIQSVLKYHVVRADAGRPDGLQLQVTTAAVSSVDPCSIQQLRLCAATGSAQGSTMALLTIMMVTGFSPEIKQLHELSHPHVKKWEEEYDRIVFYLSEVNNLPICFTMLVVRKFAVEHPLPAPVTLIDYYHPEISTSMDYSLECSTIPSLQEPLMLSDSPTNYKNQFDNFHNVDIELETPSGLEGPKPTYTCPPNSTNCQL